MQRWAGGIAVVAMVLHLVLGCSRLHAHADHLPTAASRAARDADVRGHEQACGHEHDCCSKEQAAIERPTACCDDRHDPGSSPSDECPCEVRCRTGLQFVKAERTQPADVGSAFAFDVVVPTAGAQLLAGTVLRTLDDGGPPDRFALPRHLALGRLLI